MQSDKNSIISRSSEALRVLRHRHNPNHEDGKDRWIEPYVDPTYKRSTKSHTISRSKCFF